MKFRKREEKVKPRRLYYILDEFKNPVICEDILIWGQWFQAANRHIAETNLEDCVVSSIFLGIDHNYSGKGDPVLFETMVFRGGTIASYDEYTERYCTYAEALMGHARIASKVEKRLEQEKATGEKVLPSDIDIDIDATIEALRKKLNLPDKDKGDNNEKGNSHSD